MSTPRKLAFALLFATLLLLGSGLLVLTEGAARGAEQAGIWAGVAGGLVVAVWCVQRLRRRLRSQGRHLLWVAALVYFLGAILVTVAVGPGAAALAMVMGVAGTSLGLSAWGLWAERKRTEELHSIAGRNRSDLTPEAVS